MDIAPDNARPKLWRLQVRLRWLLLLLLLSGPAIWLIWLLTPFVVNHWAQWFPSGSPSPSVDAVSGAT